MRAKIDPIDRKILQEMLLNARIPNNVLASKVGLSQSACFQRVRRLEVENVIQRYRADVDETQFGFWITLWIEVTLSPAGRTAAKELEQAFAGESRIVLAHKLVGHGDYLLKVSCKDLTEWSSVLQIIDPRSEWIRTVQVQMDAGVAKVHAIPPQLAG